MTMPLIDGTYKTLCLASTFLHFFSNVASINENVQTNAPKDIDKNIEMNNNVPVPRVFNNTLQM
jgi:hypothetical protein